MLKKYEDILVAGFLLFVSGLLFFSSLSLQRLTSSNNLGPAFAPQIIAILIALLSIFLLLKGITQLKTRNEVLEESDNRKGKYRKVKIALFSLLLYLLLLKPIGFLITTTLYLFTQFYLLAPPNKRHLKQFFVISILASACVYFVFTSLFYLRLPIGILG